MVRNTHTVPVKIANVRDMPVRAICRGLAASMETAMDGCPGFEDVDSLEAKEVESIYQNGVTLEVDVGGQKFIAEFRHVDDEVV